MANSATCAVFSCFLVNVHFIKHIIIGWQLAVYNMLIVIDVSYPSK